MSKDKQYSDDYGAVQEAVSEQRVPFLDPETADKLSWRTDARGGNIGVSVQFNAPLPREARGYVVDRLGDDFPVVDSAWERDELLLTLDSSAGLPDQVRRAIDFAIDEIVLELNPE